MDAALHKTYMRLIYRKTFKLLSAFLVISALIGGIYGDRLHFLYGVSFFSALSILLGWSMHLKAAGMRLPRLFSTREKRKTPYILRRMKNQNLHKPCFMMDYRDFDDDLTSATAVSEELFEKTQARRADMWAGFLCGAILVVLSFVVHA
jgi:hypothetical protein